MKKLTRRGFTLPEILVTVTVIAVLAAVVVPTVLQYVSKGDAPSVLSEIDAIKKGMIGFTADTRHYPQTLQQLTATIAVSSTAACSSAVDLCDLKGVNYAIADKNLWNGPYFEGAVSSTSSSKYATKALGIKFNTLLKKCGSGIGDGNDVTDKYICLELDPTGYTDATMTALDTKIDDGSAASGNLIWTPNGGTGAPTNIFYKLGVAN